MLTIDGLAMAGLGPPGMAPAAQGATSPIDFAALLATASGTQSSTARGMLGVPTEGAIALDGLLQSSMSMPVEVEPTSSSTFTLVDLLALPGLALAAGGDSPSTGTTGPDRSSEANVFEDEGQVPSLVALAAGALPPPMTPPPSPESTLGIVTSGTVSAEVPFATVASVASDSAEAASAESGPDRGQAPEPSPTGGDRDMGQSSVATGSDSSRLDTRLAARSTTADPTVPDGPRVGVAQGLTLSGQETTTSPSDLASTGGAPPTADTSAIADAPDSAPLALDLEAVDPFAHGSQPSEVARPPLDRAAPQAEGADAPSLLDTAQVDQSAVITAPPRGTDAAATVAAPLEVESTDRAVLQARLADSVLTAARTDASVRLVLNPPELGHLEVRVERTEQGLRVELVTATADAADLIKQQLPSLVSGLEARSVRVDQAEVRQAPPSGSAAFSLGSDARGAGGDASGSGRQWERPDWSDAARLDQQPTAPSSSRPRNGLLDMVA